MSILLDALKKSEKQRQLGKTPNIHTAVEAPEAEMKTEQQWIAFSMLALSAVAIAWFGWQQFREPVDTPDEAGLDIVATLLVEEPQAPIDEPDQRGMEHTADESLNTGKKSLAGSNNLPDGSPKEARERRKKLSQSFNSYEAEKATATDKEAESTPATAAKTSADRAKAQPATKRSRVAKKAPVATPARRSSHPQPHEPEPISFWQIPQALRDDMPELKINVLVYAEKPEDRFLLINGQRLVEKEELTDGIVLDEIRRDGAVFRYKKYRFLVKG